MIVSLWATWARNQFMGAEFSLCCQGSTIYFSQSFTDQFLCFTSLSLSF